VLARLAGILVLVAWGALLHAQDPGDAELNQAYQALAQKDYDSAIDLFRKTLAQQPGNASVHKDLAYTLLKAGENADVRDEFEAALRLKPEDETAALEFAFLAYETKKPIEARRTFDRLRHKGSAATRATAEQAFQNIDRPLADGIARWEQALARSANPNDLSMFSAHWELAQLAELRDDLPLAAEQYEICRKLKPSLSELLLILARVWRQLNRVDEARAALLAASRSKDSRTAELALEDLDPRYPYPYEFENALKLDPQNVALRRELAYLYLAMHKQPEAMAQFEQVLAIDPADSISRDQLDAMRGFKKRSAANAVNPAPVLASATGTDAKSMGKKSLALGYLQDAIKYFRQAHEQNPQDAEVMLRLAWAYNLAKDDADAIHWFDLARQSDDPEIAAEALKAFHALNHDAVAQTTVWALPMFSTRWKDAFVYGQVKRTIPLPWKDANKFFSFYLSSRFDGDAKGSVRTAYGPGYLSESAVILGAGVSSKTWRHITAWAEAGEALKYVPGRRDEATPDYRGGLNVAAGYGKLLGSHTPGLFYETTGDAAYVNEFDKDWLFYSQHRAGRTFHAWNNTSAQLLWNLNVVRDVKHQYWANTIETGPGMKLHVPGMPPNVYMAADFLYGIYTDGPYIDRLFHHHYNYPDFRLSFWYAITK